MSFDIRPPAKKSKPKPAGQRPQAASSRQPHAQPQRVIQKPPKSKPVQSIKKPKPRQHKGFGKGLVTLLVLIIIGAGGWFMWQQREVWLQDSRDMKEAEGPSGIVTTFQPENQVSTDEPAEPEVQEIVPEIKQLEMQFIERMSEMPENVDTLPEVDFATWQQIEQYIQEY